MASDSLSSIVESRDSESTVAERLEQPDAFSVARKRHVLNVPRRVELNENAKDGDSSWARDAVVAFREHRRRWIRNRSRRDCLDESCVFRHIFRSCRLLLMLKAKFQKRILEGWFCCTAGEVLVIAT